jgi:hypothetical protein
MIVALTQVPFNAAAEGYAEALKPEDYLAQAGDLAEKVKADIAKCTDLYDGPMVVGKPHDGKSVVLAEGQLERLFGGVKAKYVFSEVKGEERTVSVVDFSAPELKSEKLFTHRVANHCVSSGSVPGAARFCRMFLRPC